MKNAVRRALAIALSALLTGLAAPRAEARVVPGPFAAAAKKKDESKALALTHDPLKCVSTEVRPLVDAKVKPQREMEKSYVYFRASGTEDFYYVTMTARVEDVTAELPRPLAGIPGVEYYVEALDRAFLPKDTPQYAPPVTEKAVCADERATGGVAVGPQEGLTIGLTRAGQDPVPRGFNSNDIARVILVTGAVVLLAEAVQSFTAGGAAAGTAGAGSASGTGTAAAGGGAAGGGGGISTLAIVGIGVAVVGGIAIAAGGGGKGGGGGTPANRAPVFTSGPSVSPVSGVAPLTITGTATASDPDNDPVTITWSFGDSTSATGASVTHSYPNTNTYTVSATATDGKGGTTTATAGSVRVDPPNAPQFQAATVSWSGQGDLNARVAGPGGIDVATQNGGRNIPAGCGTANRTETVLYQGTSLPAGTYTLFVKHADTCGVAGMNVTFSYSVQSTAGAKCGGFSTVAPGAEVTACTFTLP